MNPRVGEEAGLVEAGLREYLNAIVFTLVIGALFILNLAIKPPDVLMSERRARTRLPALTWQSVASGSFMSKFEDFAADRFVSRDGFRAAKAAIVFDVFLQTDKSGLYFGQAGAGEFRPLDDSAARQSAEKIKRAAGMISGCNIYYAIVPDKSIYAGRYFPGFDLMAAERIFADVMRDISYIPLADCLNAGSFYKTDLHWDQPLIGDIVYRLCEFMGTAPDLNGYSPTDAGEFKGVYAGQLALPMAPDRMIYMNMPALKAQYLNETTLQFEDRPVYDLERFHGNDPYDIFLQGPQALVLLENSEAPDGDLYLFRDSYGSSLAPLLASAYRRIALIDLRYIDVRILDQFVEFKSGADVLFLYSSQILNNPSVLRVQ